MFEEMKYFIFGIFNMKTPVVINNRNRLKTLVELVEWLKGKNVEVVVLDNQSDYSPLLDMYPRLDVEVVFLGGNFGHTALQQWGGHERFKSRYFIYTDSDIVPREDCPGDLVDYLVRQKREHPEYNKVGASIEIEDLPDGYPFKSEVLNWESKYWREKRGDFYLADVDTTFAAYDLENRSSKSHCVSNCVRTDRPYTVRHLPWYITNFCEEESYYVRSANAKFADGRRVGMWTQKHRAFCDAKMM